MSQYLFVPASIYVSASIFVYVPAPIFVSASIFVYVPIYVFDSVFVFFLCPCSKIFLPTVYFLISLFLVLTTSFISMLSARRSLSLSLSPFQFFYFAVFVKWEFFQSQNVFNVSHRKIFPSTFVSFLSFFFYVLSFLLLVGPLFSFFFYVLFFLLFFMSSISFFFYVFSFLLPLCLLFPSSLSSLFPSSPMSFLSFFCVLFFLLLLCNFSPSLFPSFPSSFMS